MPEVVEIDFLRKEIKDILIGKIIQKGVLKKESLSNLNIEEFDKALKERKIINARRKGKVLIVDLSGGISLLVHFLLTGFARFYDECPKTDFHAALYFAGNSCLIFNGIMRGGFIRIVETDEIFEEKGLKHLGIDVLDPSFTLNEFKKLIYESKTKTIKDLITEQSIMSGIGNTYSDEILFEANVSPFRICATLSNDEIERVFKMKSVVFERSINYGGESQLSFVHLDGRKGEFHKYYNVHKRAGKPCFRCGSKVALRRLSGRNSYYCPNCQK
jgi:formamidopyrimidine-DNA glycosylase